MLVNVIVLANVSGIIAGLLLSMTAPSVVISFLTGLGVFKKNSLSFEKYEHVDTKNYKSQRTRYFHVNSDSYKKDTTVLIYILMTGIITSLCEMISLVLYFTLN